ncbi:MAG: amidohydrolase family protein, partial [Methanosarcinales archaeon]|nr:amidohydrolase family protein [Methanosarcinales archaeon]
PYEGYLALKDGIVREAGTGDVDATASGIILPCFVNAHTHIGDCVLKDPIMSSTTMMSLDELVKPPNGLKHRVLRDTPSSQLIEAMRHTIMDMKATGTCAFADFREGGMDGVAALKDASKGLESGIMPLVFGRKGDSDELSDIADVMAICDGAGISGTNDIKKAELEEYAAATRNEGKMLAIHAGEKDDSDIADALALSPDILIHMMHASDADLVQVCDIGASIAVCPRSNFSTGVDSFKLPLRKMFDCDINVALGTDNVMLNSPDMFCEMAFLAQLARIYRIGDVDILRMATVNGASAYGIDSHGPIIEGARSRIMVLDEKSPNLWGVKNIVSSVVRRAKASDIMFVE